MHTGVQMKYVSRLTTPDARVGEDESSLLDHCGFAVRRKNKRSDGMGTKEIPAEGMVCLLAAAAVIWIFGRIIRKRKFARDYPYEKKMLLTAAEYRFYKVLKEQCDRHRLLICPKVRMEDFLSVTDRRNRNRYREFIKSRHIDFILCDRDLHMLAGVELDDASHNTPAAERTDAFKDHVFKKIGLPLYRVPAAPGQYTARIRKIIDELI